MTLSPHLRRARGPRPELFRRWCRPGFFGQGRVRILLVKILGRLGPCIGIGGELALRDVIVRALVNPSMHELLLHFGRDGWIRFRFVRMVAARERDGPGQQ